MNPRRQGTWLVVIGVILFVLTVVVSGALAPEIGSVGDSDSRQTLVGSQGGGPGWHEYGSVYLLTGRDVTWREASAGSYFDVTKTSNGTVLAGFMDGGYQACGPYESPCSRSGFRVIDPTPTPHVISEYSFPVRDKKDSEVHDVERLPSGEYLMTDMEHERIFTVKNGAVAWQWNGRSFYDAPSDPTKSDWLHINDVDVIGDGRYLISIRNTNQLLVIQRGKGVVEVINKDTPTSSDASCRRSGQLADYDNDGDVRCGDPSVLNHQHNPQWLGDGAVLVADSDNDRIVELHRTESGEWRPVWTVGSASGVEFNWPRDADRLPNGNTLITDTLNRRIVEVNSEGKVVWSTRTSRIPYEADRLPVGETVGGPQYSSDTSSIVAPGNDIPILSSILVLLRAIVPMTPFWFGVPQLALSLFSLALILIGGVQYLRH